MVVIIALFRPWSSCKTSPLKSPDLNWLDALAELQVSMSPEHVRVTLNMQLLYQTRDAKFDFTAKRGKRLAEMMRKAKDSGINIEEEGENVYDSVWENVMQVAVDSDNLDGTLLAKNTRSTRDADEIVKEAERRGFYFVEQGTVQNIFPERT